MIFYYVCNYKIFEIKWLSMYWIVATLRLTWSRVPCDHNPILTREYSDKSGFIRFHSFIYNVEILCIILCYRNFKSFYIFFYFSSIFFLVLKLIIHFIDRMKIGKIINRKYWWICYNKENNEQFSSDIFVIHVTINEKFHSFVENRLKQWIINTSLLKHREIKDGKVYNRLETMELQRIKKYESHLEVFK